MEKALAVCFGRQQLSKMPQFSDSVSSIFDDVDAYVMPYSKTEIEQWFSKSNFQPFAAINIQRTSRDVTLVKFGVPHFSRGYVDKPVFDCGTVRFQISQIRKKICTH